MSGFKNFIMRGNLVQLAVAVVIGAQFSDLASSSSSLLSIRCWRWSGGKPNFGNLAFRVGRATFTYGAFLTEVLSFLISCLVVYYILVLPVSRLIQLLERNRRRPSGTAPSAR